MNRREGRKGGEIGLEVRERNTRRGMGGGTERGSEMRQW